MTDHDRLHARRRVLDELATGPTSEARLRAVTDEHDVSLETTVDSLRAGGFAIERAGGRYAVTSAPEDGLGVLWGLEAPFAVEHHARLASTNDRARDLAAEGAGDLAVLADVQTGGRGRRERAWASPPGGIYCSVVLRPALAPGRVQLLTLAGAVAAVRAIRAAGMTAGIKWPNDVLTPDGRKLAGVLTEAATGGGAVEWAIVGIGLNAAVEPGMLPSGAASVSAVVGDVDRTAMTRRLLEGLHELRSALGDIPDAWRRHARTPGRDVRVETDEGVVEGRAVDIDTTGALILETDAGRRTVSVGDCEHLR